MGELLQDHRRRRAEFWVRNLGARGYFVASRGNLTDEVIAQYIQLQGAEPQDEDRFGVRVEGEGSIH
jgi:putative transposase